MPNWKWWSGPNEESYWGPFETKAQAIENLDGESGYVCEAHQEPVYLSGLIDIERMLEVANDTGQDYMGESDHPLFNINDGQMLDLEKRLKFTCEQWQIANKLVFKPYTFTKQRNEEFIDGHS